MQALCLHEAALDTRAQSYLAVALATHVKEALLPDHMADELAQSWLDNSNDIHEDPLVLCVANVMGPKVLVALADRHEKKGELWLASKRLLSAASTAELVTSASRLEMFRLNKRAANLLENLHDEASRTLELVCVFSCSHALYY